LARLAYADAKLGEDAAARASTDKYQDIAILNRIASARFGWQPRFFNPRLERWLHRVKIPTHIIWGDGDRIIPPAYAEAFRRLFRHHAFAHVGQHAFGIARERIAMSAAAWGVQPEEVAGPQWIISVARGQALRRRGVRVDPDIAGAAAGAAARRNRMPHRAD